jgi:peptide/nickel transport system permease protein
VDQPTSKGNFMTDDTTTRALAVSRVKSQKPSVLRAYLRRPLGVAALVGLVVIIVACFAAPLIAPADPLAQDLTSVLGGPSFAHPLGTDTLGRDILSRLLHGGQISLESLAVALLVDLVVGIPLGLLAGYVEGPIGRGVQRIADLLMSIPGLIVLLAVVAVFSERVFVPMLALGLLGSASLLRIVSSVTIATRHELFVDAAKVNGVTAVGIMVKHIAPRIAVPSAVQAALFCGNALAQQSGLAFLGFSVLPPAPSWGGMVADAATVIQRSATYMLFSGLIIALTILCLGLIGDALGDALAAATSSSTAGARTSRAIQKAEARETMGQDARRESPDALLRVRDLSIEYAGQGAPVRVVSSVSFDVRAGETVGIVGESGCGKSTVIQGLTGVLPGSGRIVEGQILLDGVDLRTLAERERAKLRGRRIALVSQEPMNSLDPAFTVSSLISEAVRRHTGVSRREAKARTLELLTLVRLPDPKIVARRHVYELSGGMAQRVGIALALAGDPSVLLADEPTSALDVTVQSEILDLLRTIQRERGMALILVTHNWGVVADICDRVVVMYAGQVVEAATVQECLTLPMQPYTAGLLAAMPSRGVPGEPLTSIPGTVAPPQLWPVGCRFAARCPFATSECREAPIVLIEPVPGRLSRCIHIDDLVETNERNQDAAVTAA